MLNFCLHGHFYQPPRENPWTREIELQESAAPYHDWNERIYHECYLPNANAEIFDADGHKINVNNYKYLNFNFGPTLLYWILEKHPFLLKKILDADKYSINRHNGHGNAIAQVYNHIIMPLANEHDKITQIRWGMYFFEHYFGRRSEGIWLAETACDLRTIETLINEEIKYIILDINQAFTVREIGSEKWTNVSDNSINPFMPYRHYSMNKPDKFIDIFFYDGPLSKSIAFEDIMTHSEFLAKRICYIGNNTHTRNPIVSAATDGETFGHHKKGAEKILAYFFTKDVPLNNIRIVNYAEYLEEDPPTWEVKLKQGEGTSWSCIHGVSRWKEDCGCGCRDGWHLKWRKPLRESLDWLKMNIDKLYEESGRQYLKDIWNTRNDYIELIILDTPEDRIRFFNKHCNKPIHQDEIGKLMNLLEMQKYSMLMYTSCAWFFAEISGLETVKIMEYSYKAILIYKKITGINLLPEFLNKLKLAESNVPEYENGKKIFEKLVLEPNGSIIV